MLNGHRVEGNYFVVANGLGCNRNSTYHAQIGLYLLDQCSKCHMLEVARTIAGATHRNRTEVGSHYLL